MTTTLPVILLISLEETASIDEMYTNLIDKLSAKATLKRARTANAALNFLKDNSPQAILITDTGICRAWNSAVLDRAVAYSRGGGTVIVGCTFASIMPIEVMMFPIFARWGLPWKRGGFIGIDGRLNGKIAGLKAEGLVAKYKMEETWCLQNVAKEDMVYEQDPDTMPMPWPAAPECPIAFKKVGEGWVGYVGEVNALEESDKVYVAMCGLE